MSASPRIIMGLDYLVEAYGFTYTKKKKLYFVEGTVCGKQVIFLKSDHGINSSGVALNAALPILFPSRFCRDTVRENLLVLYDDIHLTMGENKMKTKGSHGGHNGMRNLIKILGAETINRVRIGAGPLCGNMEEFVLQKLTSNEKSLAVTERKNIKLLIEEYLNSL